MSLISGIRRRPRRKAVRREIRMSLICDLGRIERMGLEGLVVVSLAVDWVTV